MHGGMVSVPTYPLMLLFIEEARSRSLLISMVPLSPPGVGVFVVKVSKNPLLDSVEVRLNKRTIAACPCYSVFNLHDSA